MFATSTFRILVLVGGHRLNSTHLATHHESYWKSDPGLDHELSPVIVLLSGGVGWHRFDFAYVAQSGRTKEVIQFAGVAGNDA